MQMFFFLSFFFVAIFRHFFRPEALFFSNLLFIEFSLDTNTHYKPIYAMVLVFVDLRGKFRIFSLNFFGFHFRQFEVSFLYKKIPNTNSNVNFSLVCTIQNITQSSHYTPSARPPHLPPPQKHTTNHHSTIIC